MARLKFPFDPETANEVCSRLSGGESLLKICEDERMPGQSIIFQWISLHPEFAESYARARSFWAEAEFERMMQIADTVLIGEKTTTKADGKVEVTTGDCVDRARLQIDTRKWALARMSPRKYGDSITNKLADPDGNALKITVTGIRPTEDNT